jgi:hypothetical protein
MVMFLLPNMKGSWVVVRFYVFAFFKKLVIAITIKYTHLQKVPTMFKNNNGHVSFCAWLIIGLSNNYIKFSLISIDYKNCSKTH